MKKFFGFLCAAVLVSGFCACAGNVKSDAENYSQNTARTLARSMRGYELYSWLEGGQWKFVMAEAGSPGLSSYAEITIRDDVMTGADAVIAKLRQLPENQEVYWNLRQMEGFEYPDRSVTDKILSACEHSGIIMQAVRLSMD